MNHFLSKIKTVQKIVAFYFLFFSTSSYSQSNQGFHFDGIDDYINLNVLQKNVFTHQDSFTIEFRMQADLNAQTSSIRTVMFAINQPLGENRLLMVLGGLSSQDGKLMIYDEVIGSGAVYTSSQVIGDNVCHHIAYSYNGNTGRVYIDGTLVHTHTVTYNITSSDRYSLGQEWDNFTPSQFYNGFLDEVRVWKEARSATEIFNYKDSTLSGNEPNLIACYSMNQGTPGGNNTAQTSMLDSSPNSFHGTFVNSALTGSISNFILGDCSDTSTPPSPEEPNDFEIQIPNVFSPNGDGINDVIPAFNFPGSFNFTILNRWGNIVHRTNDKTINTVWDGEALNGKKCSEGTYFYIFEGNLKSGEEVKSHGFIMLVK